MGNIAPAPEPPQPTFSEPPRPDLENPPMEATAEQSAVSSTNVVVPIPSVVFRRPTAAMPSPRALLHTSSGIIKTFMCRICLCYQELSHASTVSGCSHQFCLECLARYLTSQITDGQVNLQCPFMSDDNVRCDTMLGDDAVEAVVPDDVLAKWKRFKAARENPDLRACPGCETLLKGDPQNPQMTCSCGCVFCFVHSDAHPPTESCAAFEERSRGQDAVSQAFVNKTSKPCPKCRSLTYKYTGCNHMKCPQCGQDWCWLCGESIVITGPYPRHYDRRNPTSACAGKQFTTDGNEEQDVTCCNRFFRILFYYSPLAAPFYLFAMVLYALVTVTTFPCLLASEGYRHCWLRRCIILRIVTLCWAVICFSCLLTGVFTGFVVVWIVGVTLGTLCLPFCAFGGRAELGRHVWCCCCWPAVLVNGVLNEDTEV
eukprot:GGOE01014582.1.p1 GENE.GGOE01014582.1~~GGOE01014582.1.p1  ORF type:complete len:454 (+),score=112.26 GGOE01014582.1:80-1363(+)